MKNNMNDIFIRSRIAAEYACLQLIKNKKASVPTDSEQYISFTRKIQLCLFTIINLNHQLITGANIVPNKMIAERAESLK